MEPAASQTIAEKHLSEYPTTLEDDVKELEGGKLKPYSNARHARIQVKGEKVSCQTNKNIFIYVHAKHRCSFLRACFLSIAIVVLIVVIVFLVGSALTQQTPYQEVLHHFIRLSTAGLKALSLSDPDFEQYLKDISVEEHTCISQYVAELIGGLRREERRKKREKDRQTH